MFASKWRAFCTALAAVAMLAVCSPAAGEVYKWVDEEGVVHFQDSAPTAVSPSIRVEIIATPRHAASYPAPVQEDGIEFYDIQGDGPHELWLQMVERGRRLKSGEVAIAWASCSMKCMVNVAGRNGNHVVESAKAIADISITMPRWTGLRRATGDMQYRWKRFYDAVLAHEHGHKEDFATAVTELERQVAALPPMRSREELLAAANAACRDTESKYEKRAEEYDARTDREHIRGLLFQ